MTAEIISLPTASPDVQLDAGPDHDDYLLELEHENAELREIIAKGELRRWRAHPPKGRKALVATLLASAFVVGWTIDPPNPLGFLGFAASTAGASAAAPPSYTGSCRFGV